MRKNPFKDSFENGDLRKMFKIHLNSEIKTKMQEKKLNL